MLHDLELLHKIATALRRPGAAYKSINQLSKRTRTDDDKARRSCARLEDYLRTRLFVIQGGRLVLTPPAAALADIAGRLVALCEGVSADDGPEPLVIDAAGVLADTLLPLALPDLFAASADTLRCEVRSFNPVATPERLDNGETHLALGWASGEGGGSAEVLGAEVRWVAVLPRGHAFTKREVGAGEMAAFHRVFVPGDEHALAATASALRPVPAGCRVELPSVPAVLAAVASGCGVGVVPLLPWAPPPSFRSVPLAGVEPDRPAVFLPRRASDLTEGASSLLAILKRVAAEPYPPPVPEVDAAEPEASAEPVPLVSA